METIFLVSSVSVLIFSLLFLIYIVISNNKVSRFNLIVGFSLCLILIVSLYSILGLLLRGTVNLVLAWTCVGFSVVFWLILFACIFLIAFFYLTMQAIRAIVSFYVAEESS